MEECILRKVEHAHLDGEAGSHEGELRCAVHHSHLCSRHLRRVRSIGRDHWPLIQMRIQRHSLREILQFFGRGGGVNSGKSLEKELKNGILKAKTSTVCLQSDQRLTALQTKSRTTFKSTRV